MSDLLSEYRRTAEDVQEALVVTKGLTTALYDMAHDFSGIQNNDPAASAIMVLIRLADEKVQEVLDKHDAEWKAVFAAENAGKKAKAA